MADPIGTTLGVLGLLSQGITAIRFVYDSVQAMEDVGVDFIRAQTSIATEYHVLEGLLRRNFALMTHPPNEHNIRGTIKDIIEQMARDFDECQQIMCKYQCDYSIAYNENHLKPHISASDAAVTDKIHSNGRPNSKSEPALLLDSTINGSKERMSAARPKITPEVLRNQILVELSPKNSLRIPKYSRRKSTERTEVQEISNGAQMSKKRSSWRVWIKFSHRDPESKKSNGPSSPSSGHLQPPSIHVSDHIGLDKVKEKQNESRMRVQSDTGLFQKNLLD